jgi:hypothetical protein
MSRDQSPSFINAGRIASLQKTYRGKCPTGKSLSEDRERPACIISSVASVVFSPGRVSADEPTSFPF